MEGKFRADADHVEQVCEIKDVKTFSKFGRTTGFTNGQWSFIDSHVTWPDSPHVTTEHNHDAQPNVYRSLEVMLKVEWSYAIDIWNVGVMVCLQFSSPSYLTFSLQSIKLFETTRLTARCTPQIWDLFEGKHLFHGSDID